MSINFEVLDIRAFLAVFESGSFNKAADALNISQPALSRRIRAFEDKVGAPLFERTTRRVSPTATGRQLHPALSRMVEELEMSILSANTGGRRAEQVTVACGPTAASYLLPHIIRKFNARFPSIRIRVLDLLASEGLESITRGEAEFGINMLGFSEPHLRFTPLIKEPFVLVCQHSHPLARRRPLKWADLANEPLIGFSRQSGIRTILDHALASSKNQLNWFYEVNHLSAAMGMVEAGLGAAILPRLAAPRDKSQAIVVVPVGGPTVTRTIGIVERRTGSLSPAASLFRETVMSFRRPR